MSNNLESPSLDKIRATFLETSQGWFISENQSLNVFYGKEDALPSPNSQNLEAIPLVPNIKTTNEIASAVQNLPWPFCIRWNGSPYYSTIFYAPSPGEAATTAVIFVQSLNVSAQRLGYPPLFSVTPNACPV